MALGSSAPEILLAIIGIVGNNFESEKLGPSTIVGSAAFNLLAYIWLVLVLVVISKDLIEIREAVLTFLFFPLLVIIAYSAVGR